MCQKLAEHLSFHMKYLDLHLKKKIDKTNFVSPKKLLTGHSGQKGLKQQLIVKIAAEVH